MRLTGNCLENVFIIYHMVIRRLEKFLRAFEVQLETLDFYEGILTKLSKVLINHADFHVFEVSKNLNVDFTSQ